MGWLSSRSLFHQGDGFCRRFLKTPEEQKQAFAQFVDSLQKIPEGRLAYLLFKTQSPDQKEADQAFSAYVDELWNRRYEAVESKIYSPVWEMPVGNGSDVLTRNAGKMVPLLRYFLTHWHGSPTAGSILRLLWQPGGWSEEEARAVWPDYLLFKDHFTNDWKAKGNILSSLPVYLAAYENPFHEKFPQFDLATSSASDKAGALVVHRFWCAMLSPQAPGETVHYSTWDLTKDALWMTCVYDGSSNVICRVGLPGLRTEVIELPAGISSQNIRVTRDAIYIDYAVPNSEIHGLARYNFATKAWTLRPLTLSISKFYMVGEDIYLDLWSLQSNPYKEETGLARYDWSTGAIKLLDSSRRKPALNQFDDRTDQMKITFSRALDVFAGPRGKPCMTTAEGTFYIQDQPGNWPTVFDAAFGGQPLTLYDKTIVATHDGEVVLLSPKKETPEYLMATSSPSFRKLLPKPVKENAPWASQSLWDAPLRAEFGADGYCNDNIGYHDGEFFVLMNSSAQIKGDYELLVYSKKSGRALPLHIPLRFHLNSDTRQFLESICKGESGKNLLDNIEQPGESLFRPDLIATSKGLCFHLFGGGFWLLPYEDIESYLKDRSLAPLDSSLSAKTPMSVQKIDTTSSGESKTDPENPTSFR